MIAHAVEPFALPATALHDISVRIKAFLLLSRGFYSLKQP